VNEQVTFQALSSEQIASVGLSLKTAK